MPATHASSLVQTDSSLQPTPSGSVFLVHLPVLSSQPSTVQLLPSSHWTFLPALHSPATHWSPLETPGLYSAKAFDNRVGVALVIEAMGKLGGAPCTVIGAACVQEEVGTRGAKTLVGHVRPDLAIVLESPPADDIPGFGAETRQGALGSGPQVRLYDPTMIAHPSLASFVRKIAADNGIPHQIAVCQSGGTDAGTIHTSGVGIPTIVLGVPVRNTKIIR